MVSTQLENDSLEVFRLVKKYKIDCHQIAKDIEMNKNSFKLRMYPHYSAKFKADNIEKIKEHFRKMAKEFLAFTGE